MFTEEEVLRIVDACFHAYASDYRNDAKEYAKDIMARIMRTKTCDKPAVSNNEVAVCDFCDKPMTNKTLRTCDEHAINRRM